MKIIVDGDIVAFMAAIAMPDDTRKAIERSDEIMTDIIESLFVDGFDDVIVFVKGRGNFRMDCESYKSNRAPKPDAKPRPTSLEPVREHLGRVYGEFAHGAEADDYCVTEAQMCKDEGIDYIICTIDKDLRQMEGKHLNLRTGVIDLVTPEDGYSFLLQQCLTGDAVDGIQGIKGVGPAKARKLLDANPDEPELAILAEYTSRFGIDKGYADLEECWNLVYMRRSHANLMMMTLPKVFTIGRRGSIPYE